MTLLFNLMIAVITICLITKDWVEEARKQLDKSLSKDKLPPFTLLFQTLAQSQGYGNQPTSDVISLKKERQPGPIQDDNETAYFWVLKTP